MVKARISVIIMNLSTESQTLIKFCVHQTLQYQMISKAVDWTNSKNYLGINSLQKDSNVLNNGPKDLKRYHRFAKSSNSTQT